MSYFGTTDWLTEVKKGNVPGHEIVSIIARNPAVPITVWADLWGPGGLHTEPVANESWEMVCASANDTAAGTGAQEVTAFYLDSNYDLQTSVTATNGGTQTLNGGTTYYRPQFFTVTAVGTTGYNEGDITIQTTGGAGSGIQGLIPFIAADRGFCISQDGHYAIPSDKTGFGLQVIPFFGYNTYGSVRVILQTENGPEYTGAELPLYQSGVPLNIQSPFSLPPKTDINFQAVSGSGTVPVILSATLLLVDTDLVGESEIVSLIGF